MFVKGLTDLCTVLIIFNGPGACGGGGLVAVLTDQTASPALVLPDLVSVAAGDTVSFPLAFSPGDHAISSLAFSLDLDPRWLAFAVADPAEVTLSASAATLSKLLPKICHRLRAARGGSRSKRLVLKPNRGLPRLAIHEFGHEGTNAEVPLLDENHAL